MPGLDEIKVGVGVVDREPAVYVQVPKPEQFLTPGEAVQLADTLTLAARAAGWESPHVRRMVCPVHGPQTGPRVGAHCRGCGAALYKGEG